MLLFGAIALLLSAIGIYGIIAYASAERHGEVATRMALGATHTNIFALLSRQGLAVAVIGAVIGLGLAYAAGRIASTGFTEWSSDPLILISALALVWPHADRDVDSRGARGPINTARSLDSNDAVRPDPNATRKTRPCCATNRTSREQGAQPSWILRRRRSTPPGRAAGYRSIYLEDVVVADRGDRSHPGASESSPSSSSFRTTTRRSPRDRGARPPPGSTMRSFARPQRRELRKNRIAAGDLDELFDPANS